MTDVPVFSHVTPILDEEIEEVRNLLGRPLRIPGPWNHEATLDTIRHYSLGIGDDNPLWCDEAYAGTGPYGGIVGPPTWLYSNWAAGIGPGFGGLQAFHAGGRWDIKRYVRAGDRVVAEAKMTELRDVQGRRSGRMLIQVGEVVYRTTDGEVLAVHEARAFRLPRRSAGGGLNYESKPPQHYTAEEYERIESAVLNYKRRGAERLYWEDVSEGDPLPVMAKGPLDLPTMIAYYAGNLQMYRTVDLAIRNRRFARENPDRVPNNRPIEWALEATAPGLGHHDVRVAQSVGMPGVYDNGWMRIGWMGQLVTDWIGDHGVLTNLDVSIRLPNVIGDTLWCTGKVASKSDADGQHLVHLEIWGDRQDGETSCKGTAVVALPSRSS